MTKGDIYTILRGNSYPGRGIIAGLSEDGQWAATAYFIMGRSLNSRNRVFVPTADGIRTQAFDESKMSDPSLIIYHPVRTVGDRLIVTNGDQTDTIAEHLSRGGSFEGALETRRYEPDAPNYTPRISAMLDFSGVYRYRMSILKCSDGLDGGCDRFTFCYEPVKGRGHFLHTYDGDGDPIPSFSTVPETVGIPDDPAAFAAGLWESLNGDNKVSLYVCYRRLADGEMRMKIINRHIKEA